MNLRLKWSFALPSSLSSLKSVEKAEYFRLFCCTYPSRIKLNKPNLIKSSQTLIIFAQICYNEINHKVEVKTSQVVKGGMDMKPSYLLSETEVLSHLEAQPSLVRIKGNRQAIELSYQNLSIMFPVREHIYTRWVCALEDAKIVTTDQTFDVSPSIIQALASIAESRRASSFDLKFQ